jgi:hypothetical protein
MGPSRFGGGTQEVDGLRGVPDARQAMRAAAPQVLADIPGALLRERAQPPQLEEFI